MEENNVNKPMMSEAIDLTIDDKYQSGFTYHLVGLLTSTVYLKGAVRPSAGTPKYDIAQISHLSNFFWIENPQFIFK